MAISFYRDNPIIECSAKRFVADEQGFEYDYVDIDCVSGPFADSLYIFDLTNNCVKIKLAEEHFDLIREYLDYKLNVPVIDYKFDTIVWSPNYEEAPFSLEVDNMKRDSVVIWNTLVKLMEV